MWPPRATSSRTCCRRCTSTGRRATHRPLTAAPSCWRWARSRLASRPGSGTDSQSSYPAYIPHRPESVAASAARIRKPARPDVCRKYGLMSGVLTKKFGRKNSFASVVVTHSTPLVTNAETLLDGNERSSRCSMLRSGFFPECFLGVKLTDHLRGKGGGLASGLVVVIVATSAYSPYPVAQNFTNLSFSINYPD